MITGLFGWYIQGKSRPVTNFSTCGMDFVPSQIEPLRRIKLFLVSNFLKKIMDRLLSPPLNPLHAYVRILIRYLPSTYVHFIHSNLASANAGCQYSERLLLEILTRLPPVSAHL